MKKTKFISQEISYERQNGRNKDIHKTQNNNNYDYFKHIKKEVLDYDESTIDPVTMTTDVVAMATCPITKFNDSVITTTDSLTDDYPTTSESVATNICRPLSNMADRTDTHHYNVSSFSMINESLFDTSFFEERRYPKRNKNKIQEKRYIKKGTSDSSDLQETGSNSQDFSSNDTESSYDSADDNVHLQHKKLLYKAFKRQKTQQNYKVKPKRQRIVVKTEPESDNDETTCLGEIKTESDSEETTFLEENGRMQLIINNIQEGEPGSNSDETTCLEEIVKTESDSEKTTCLEGQEERNGRTQLVSDNNEEREPGSNNNEEREPGSNNNEEREPGSNNNEEREPGSNNNEEREPGSNNDEQRELGSDSEEESDKTGTDSDSDESWCPANEENEKKQSTRGYNNKTAPLNKNSRVQAGIRSNKVTCLEERESTGSDSDETVCLEESDRTKIENDISEERIPEDEQRELAGSDSEEESDKTSTDNDSDESWCPANEENEKKQSTRGYNNTTTHFKKNGKRKPGIRSNKVTRLEERESTGSDSDETDCFEENEQPGSKRTQPGSKRPQPGSKRTPLGSNGNTQPGNITSYISEDGKTCLLCKRKFSVPFKLRRHILTHTNEKSFQCEICDKKFSRKDTLTKHIRTHTGNKPHECEFCGKTFNSTYHLRLHLSVHTGEKYYKCQYCDKEFIAKGNYKQHLNVHTGDKPHKCNICGKRFSFYNSYKSHLRIHAGDKRYKCLHCEKRFSQNVHLKKHLYCVHNVEK